MEIRVDLDILVKR